MFNLKDASVEIRKASSAMGIKSGEFEPVNAGTPIDALHDDAVVAKVWNSRKSAEITAGDVRYAHEYL